MEAQTNATEAYAVAFAQLTAQFAQHWEPLDWSDGPIAWFLSPDMVSAPHQWKIPYRRARRRVRRCSRRSARRCVSSKSVQGAATDPDIVFLNSGDAGGEQLGKVVTIYPRDDARATSFETRFVWPVSGSRGADRPALEAASVSFPTAYSDRARRGQQHGRFTTSRSSAPTASLADVRPLQGEQSPLAPAPPVPGCAGHAAGADQQTGHRQRLHGHRVELSETPRALT
jgi:hypothetical protein